MTSKNALRNDPSFKAGCRAVAERIVAAERSFEETVSHLLLENGTPHTGEDLSRIRAWMLKRKLAKLDPVFGEIKVTHGSFLEGVTLARILILSKCKTRKEEKEAAKIWQ